MYAPKVRCYVSGQKQKMRNRRKPYIHRCGRRSTTLYAGAGKLRLVGWRYCSVCGVMFHVGRKDLKDIKVSTNNEFGL